MRKVVCLWLLGAVCLAGCSETKENIKPYVPLPADMDTSCNTPMKEPPAKDAPAKPAQ
jgi:hypothetical protein